jgi:hypothetical protein
MRQRVTSKPRAPSLPTWRATWRARPAGARSSLGRGRGISSRGQPTAGRPSAGCSRWQRMLWPRRVFGPAAGRGRLRGSGCGRPPRRSRSRACARSSCARASAARDSAIPRAAPPPARPPPHQRNQHYHRPHLDVTTSQVIHPAITHHCDPSSAPAHGATPKSGSCQGGGPYAAWRAGTLAADGRRKAVALRLTCIVRAGRCR